MPTYVLPTQVRLEFDRDGTPNPFLSPGFTTQVQAQVRRAYIFYDTGHSDGLYVLFGSKTGQLNVADLMLATDYEHTASADEAAPSGHSGQLWLPGDLTPVTGGALVTTDISLFFDETGHSGTAFAVLPCIAQPTWVQPQMLAEGLSAASVVYRWEIRDDDPPTVTT